MNDGNLVLEGPGSFKETFFGARSFSSSPKKLNDEEEQPVSSKLKATNIETITISVFYAIRNFSD